MAHKDARRTSPPQFAVVLTTLIHPASLSKRKQYGTTDLKFPSWDTQEPGCTFLHRNTKLPLPSRRLVASNMCSEAAPLSAVASQAKADQR